MGVMIDDSSLDTQSLGLVTVGDVLGHVTRDQRLVVQLTIDGKEPDLNQIDSIRRCLIRDHVVFMETADPAQVARDVLEEVDHQLVTARTHSDDAVKLLRQGVYNEALKRLSTCFGAWSMARDSLDKVSRLMKIDLNTMQYDGSSMGEVVQNFADQLTRIREALESRDYVMLADTLNYDMQPVARRWSGAIESIKNGL